jgi:DNA invertase Pin-like site-specific DNA recombinase
MAYRQLRTRQAIEQDTQPQALTDRPVALIARQSSTRQTRENVESLKLQVEDAVEKYISQGWSQDIITVHVAGNGTRGVSASKLRIDQRSELQDTIADIKAGSIKLVGAYSVSRLFRDKWGVQVGTFMEVCAEYDVLVKIGDRVYDFNDANDRLIFKIEAEFAAKDNELRTKLLTDARRRKSKRGEYDGRPLVVGFIVDRDKTSSTYGKFIVYEPHAKVVRRLYARYRELGGRFNLLAREVAMMAVVFPDFEEWVNKLDVSRLRLKRVVGGYHIGRNALFNLLMAVEYVGFWKVNNEVLIDEQGKPIQAHQPIVDQDVWEYAFTRLSFTTLTGEPNTERIETRSNWIPANKSDGKSSLLHGILTSPIGTVQNSDGKYRVTELRPGHLQRSNTLTVDAQYIDVLFSARLSERLVEMQAMGKGDFLKEQLAQMEQTNNRALVGVDKQIARYQNEIKGMQAYIKATGATADEKTLLEYNTQILDARANLDALLAKKNAAKVKENSMHELIRRVSQLTGSDCYCSTETSRQFIELACERVELDEYSSHLLTLTVVWSVPFAQTDVCFIWREDGGHVSWDEADEFDLAMLYPLVDRKAMLERFPAHTWMSIFHRANKLGYERYTQMNTSGLTDRNISLREHELLQANGWSLDETIEGTDIKAKRHAWWLYDVPSQNGVSDGRLYPAALLFDML